MTPAKGRYAGPSTRWTFWSQVIGFTLAPLSIW
jgi:hypothetical protein